MVNQKYFPILPWTNPMPLHRFKESKVRAIDLQYERDFLILRLKLLQNMLD